MVNFNSQADKFFTENSMADERAIVESRGFSVAYNGKQFLVTDPAIQAVHGKKFAKWTCTPEQLKEIIGDAVAARNLFNNEQAKKAAAEPVVEPVPETVTEPQPEPVNDPEPVVEPQPEPVVEPVPDAEPVADLPAPKELSGDIELDETGKRERKAKVEKAPKVPFANRYERSAKIILDNLHITPVELAKQASMSESMAVYCIESFVGTVKAFLAAGIIAKNKTSIVTYVKPESKKAKASK